MVLCGYNKTNHSYLAYICSLEEHNSASLIASGQKFTCCIEFDCRKDISILKLLVRIFLAEALPKIP